MNSFSYCVEKFSLIPAHYGGTGHSGKKNKTQNILNESKLLPDEEC